MASNMEFMNNLGNLGVRNLNIVPSCKCHFKWIVIVGNKYRDEEIDPENKICSNEEYLLQNLDSAGESIARQTLSQKVLQSNIVEIYLDSVLSEKNDLLTPELFKCVNVRVLSLRKNNLLYLPADIGRLSKLRTLILTENFLTDHSIPYTLTFCKYLRTLHLGHNFLDALPGFLLEMPHLETVYRHGNDNYFKSTFLWFHSSKKDRVLPLIPHSLKSGGISYQPNSLQTHSIISLIASKINFFKPGLLPITLQEHISQTYLRYIICSYCSKAFCQGSGGFKVFTFKSPYLGNTCVPFQHWTCSRECGVALEQPAQQQERDQAREADRQYQQYITSIQRDFCLSPPNKNKSKPSCLLM